jgi:hypothetical protein
VVIWANAKRQSAIDLRRIDADVEKHRTEQAETAKQRRFEAYQTFLDRTYAFHQHKLGHARMSDEGRAEWQAALMHELDAVCLYGTRTPRTRRSPCGKPSGLQWQRNRTETRRPSDRCCRPDASSSKPCDWILRQQLRPRRIRRTEPAAPLAVTAMTLSP